MAPEYFFPMLGMAFVLAWGVIGTFRWYAGEKLKIERRNAAPAADDERLAAVESRVQELEERLDFAERLLTQAKQNQLSAGREPGP
ncbi:MAG TPA: hypothetical protein VJL31_04420 [Gemmatimonadales bacterium]|jgi:hypothetical protein|nr:hypothetical protein [Gemmatimonadales bacterium]